MHPARIFQNYPIATTEQPPEVTTKSRYDQGLEDYDEAAANARQGRVMMDVVQDFVHDNHHDHEIIVDHPPTMKEETKQAIDSWSSYYEFIITEGSFKFWAAFQLFTALLLIYSSLAAAYYAKFNIITTDYDYYDDFFGRSNNAAQSTNLWSGLTSSTIQRIFDAISSKKYT
ncbi:uncharacterized protein LOC130894872 [Diorhabda carinulata]|uniref:uncharacterized protein LOC130894872 n=1 Tax=Diorhabda carinulata TaxID=1163345 RepID=UPI0025A1CE19|nr:uncharacterized protein LOC130894872 [Diorhabda carinulata]